MPEGCMLRTSDTSPGLHHHSEMLAALLTLHGQREGKAGLAASPCGVSSVHCSTPRGHTTAWFLV